MTDKVREEVVAIVAEVGEISVADVLPGSTLRELGIDSLGGLRIVAEVEKRYGIVIPEEEITKIRSMADIFALVEAHPPRS
jgi:acyl carrier protein